MSVSESYGEPTAAREFLEFTWSAACEPDPAAGTAAGSQLGSQAALL